MFVIAVLLLSACMPIQDPAAMQAEVPRIVLDEAKQHYDGGTAIFVDARSADDYENAHIDGAIHLLPGTVDNELPKDQLIITYCT